MAWRDTHTPLRVALQRPWPTMLRGLVLWFFALGLGVLGLLNYVLTTPSPTGSGTALAFHLWPPPVWGWIMVGVAALCVWSSYCHHGRDRLGFSLYGLFCGCWGFQFVAAFALTDEAGLRAVGSGVVWSLLGAGMVLVAGLPNTPVRFADRPGQELVA